MSRRLALCCAPQLIVALDFALLGVSAPAIRADLHLGDAAFAWLFSAYSVTFGALLLIAGRAADALGRRPVLAAGLALFAAGATLVATAGTAPVALAARAAQGAGAALMTPAALALLSEAFPEGAERRRALAVYGVVISGGFVAGSLIGGIAGGALGWRASLLLDAVPALAALVLLAAERRQPSHAGEQRDAATLPRGGWDRAQVAAACAAVLVLTATGVGAVVLLTLHLQEVRGYGALETGLAFTAFGSTALAGGAAARRVAARHGPLRAAALGLAVQGAALAALGAVSLNTAAALLAGLAAFGLGHTAANAAIPMAALAGAPPVRHGVVGATLATVQFLGAAAGPLAAVALGRAAGLSAAGLACLATAAALGVARPRRG
ncbi:MAG TPA: MFS transporter [Solirubrobacteraceae bacterium]